MQMQKPFSYPKLIILFFVLSGLNIYAQEVTSSGAFCYTYPLSLPAGRNGMRPSLSLVYNSYVGNGILGMGWSLAGFSLITRDPAYDISFDDAADHFLLDGQRLIKGADGYYHTEKESYARIEYIVPTKTDYSDPSKPPIIPDYSNSYWIVTLKNGTKMYYGYFGGRVNAIGKVDKALVWCLNRVEDVMRNIYIITYNQDETNGDIKIKKYNLAILHDRIQG
jgi:hypothetical protein